MLKVILFITLCLLNGSYSQTCTGGSARIISAGTDDGNSLQVYYPNGAVVKNISGGNPDMGLYLFVLSNGAVQQETYFKLATNGEGLDSENTRLKTVIEALPANTYVLVGIKGGSQMLTQVGMDALKLLGANQWSTIGKERVSFAMIGKRGATNQPQMFKLPKAGVSTVEACVETGKASCTAKQYYTGTECKDCDAGCNTCQVAATKCVDCASTHFMANFAMGLCLPSGGIVSCPAGMIKMNKLCIDEQCIGEISTLNDITGTCEQLTSPARTFKSTIKLNGFPMRQNCAYSAELTVEGKDAKLIPVTFETKLEDLTSTITFSKTFAEVIATCPVEDTTDQVKYTCKYYFNVIMAKIPQTEVQLTQTVIVNKDTGATLKGVTIEKNVVTPCTGDKCIFPITVTSEAKQCVSFADCSSATSSSTFKRGDPIFVRQQITDPDLKTWYLKPKTVKLVSEVTEIVLKQFTTNNEKPGEIIYMIPLVVALGTVDLQVTSTISQTKLMLRYLQTGNTEKVVSTSQTITLTDEKGTTPPVGTSEDDGWKAIVIGVVVGVGGAIIIALISFFVYRKLKAQKREKNYEDPAAKGIEMSHEVKQ